MRTLTIERKKSFVGSLAKLKVYIEDPQSEELSINGLACRKLGELKNGETGTFQVEDRAAKVFVIADKLSRNYCNDFYELPEGTEGIALSGKTVFNPASGNAFRFDDNTGEGAMENRKKGVRTGLIVLLVAVAVGIVGGFFIGRAVVNGRRAEKKEFSAEELRVTLTNGFYEIQLSQDLFTGSFASKDVAVYVLRDPYEAGTPQADWDEKTYRDLTVQYNEVENEAVSDEDGLPSYQYDYPNPEDSKEYHYYAYVYKSEKAFWLVSFCTEKSKAGQYEASVKEWAKTVRFDE